MLVICSTKDIYLFIYSNIFIQGKTQFSKILFFNAALFSEKSKIKLYSTVDAIVL